MTARTGPVARARPLSTDRPHPRRHDGVVATEVRLKQRFVQVAAAIGVVVLGCAGQATAQPLGDRPVTVQFNGGVSFGGSTGGTYGVEGDYVLTPKLTVFAELGQITNVAPGFIVDRAELVASAIGAGVDVKDRATYFDAGVKYALPTLMEHYEPYVGLGIGVAHVSKDTTFSVNGADLSEDQLLNDYGVQLGADLADSSNKATFAILLGVTRAIGERYGMDVSYRYNRIFAKSDLIEGDKGISANRIQAGFFVRF
jgi:opacity protein-like surface antigen